MGCVPHSSSNNPEITSITPEKQSGKILEKKKSEKSE
jgi:hypothetical protein